MGAAQSDRGPHFLVMIVGHLGLRHSCRGCHPALPHVLVGAAPLLVLLLTHQPKLLLPPAPVSAEEGGHQDKGDHEGDGGDEDHCDAVEDGGEAGGEGGHRGDVSAPPVLGTGGEWVLQPRRWRRWRKVPQGRRLGRTHAHSQQLKLSFESMRCGAADWQKPTEGYEGGAVC